MCVAHGRRLPALLQRHTLNHKRRQDLYAYAAKVVGSAGSPEVESARASRLVQWADGRRVRRIRWPFRRRPARRTEPHRRVNQESAARSAIRSIRRVSDETHANVLALIDELIEFGKPADPVDAEALRRRPDQSRRAVTV
jgi:hypothetical protein